MQQAVKQQLYICISDVDVRDPDEKSIMTYVAQFLQYSKDASVSDEEMQVRYTHMLYWGYKDFP